MLLFLCYKVNRTQRSMYYLYYKRQRIHRNLRNELHIRGKQHLCKGCNEGDTASNDCSTFQGLPKANTRCCTHQFWNGRLEKEKDIQKPQCIYQSSPINNNKQLWQHLDKLRKSGSLNASCHPQQLPTIILQLKAKIPTSLQRKSKKDQPCRCSS